MSKKIRLSDDSGTTWHSLPGSEGSFNANGEQIDDTILGQTYKSNESGLIGWSIGSNAIFKGFAGYLAEIKQVGTATAMTDEACSLVSGLTYQITDATRRIIDRSQAVTVEDNNAAVAASNIESIDYLFGRVTFATGYTPAGAITITGNYFPTSQIGRANTYNLNMSAEAIDETDFATAQGNSGHKVFTPGLRTVSLELGGIFSAADAFKTVLANRQEVIIEIDPAGDGSSIARGFFKLTDASQAGAVGALEEETLNFTLVVPDETTNPQVEYPFNWQHTNTTLNQAIQIAITSWLEEDNTVEAQYLPSGAPGQNPLDGIQGPVVFTDISLSGGLNNMNTFSAEMQGTGGYTVV